MSASLTRCRRTGKVTAEEREAKRLRLMETARRLHQEHGCGGLTVERLAREVGTSVGGVYLLVPNLLAIYAELLRADLDAIRDDPGRRGQGAQATRAGRPGGGGFRGRTVRDDALDWAELSRGRKCIGRPHPGRPISCAFKLAVKRWPRSAPIGSLVYLGRPNSLLLGPKPGKGGAAGPRVLPREPAMRRSGSEKQRRSKCFDGKPPFLVEFSS